MKNRSVEAPPLASEAPGDDAAAPSAESPQARRVRLVFTWAFGLVVAGLALPAVVGAMVVGVQVLLGEERGIPSDSFLATLPEEVRAPMWVDFLAATEGDRTRYRTNTHWIAGPYAGEFYNVSEAGVRRTVQASEGGPRVFMFGGSTMWGYHSSDAETLPSLVSAELARRGISAQLVNHGQIGYVSAQEATYLAQLVATGDAPAVAVFFDGLNDVDVPQRLASYGYHAPAELPHLHFADMDLRAERARRDDPWKMTRAGLLKFRVVSAFADSRLGRRLHLRPEPPGQGGGWDEEDERRKVELIASGYATTLAMVEGLAHARGFEPLFFWQPTISRKKTLTDHETPPKFIGAENGDHFTAAAEAVRRAVGDDPHFRDISGLLDDMTETAYTDGRHYTLRAKEVIAARIAADLAALLEDPERLHGDGDGDGDAP